MELTITTPAILFPVVSLFFISFNARFLALASRTRGLVRDWELAETPELKNNISRQLDSLRSRIQYIRFAQSAGALSLLFAILSCLTLLWVPQTVLQYWNTVAISLFTVSLCCLLFAVGALLVEIKKSTMTLAIVLERIK
jgi:hypothetical protein